MPGENGTAMIKLLGLVILVVALAFVLLGVNIFLFRRKFPETEVGSNRHMKDLGLTCPHCEERKHHKRTLKSFSIRPEKLRPDWENIKK